MDIEEFKKRGRKLILLYNKETGLQAIQDNKLTNNFIIWRAERKRIIQINKLIKDDNVTAEQKELMLKFHSPLIRILREEFIETYGTEPIEEYYNETGKQAFFKNGRHIKEFEGWLWRTPKYHYIARAIHVPVWRDNVEEYIIENLDDYYRKQIPKEKYKEIVYLVKMYTNKFEALKEIVKILNRRWIFKQLNLDIQKTDKREIFYKVRKSLGGVLDIKGSKKDQQERMQSEIDGYYKHFYEFLGFNYWGYVPDYLGVDIKGTAIIYDSNMNEVTLTKKNLTDFENVPFFLIICEKTILIDFTMRELINRGYDKGFYGISLGGYAVTAVIKYLIPLSKIRSFYVFVQHDLDADGLKIYFNVRECFSCESVGINPDFLEYIGVDFKDIAEDYNVTPKQKVAQETGARNRVLELDLTENERYKYNNWIDSCLERRAEINSLLTKREEEDYTKNKARDFVDYLISVIEDPERPWNLNRVRQLKKEMRIERFFGDDEIIWTIKTKLPRVNVWPKSMLKFDNQDIIKDKIQEEHKDYLDIITEIGDLMTTNIKNIEGKLENLAEAENDAIEGIIDKIEEEYPKLFDEMPEWRNILQSKYPGKINKLNSLIKVSGKAVRIGNIRKYIELTKQLKSHKGSIKGNAPEKAITAKEKILKKHTENNVVLKGAEERIEKFNRHLQIILRRTDEYKEVKADITKLEEELENRVVEEDEREGVLKEFKEKLEEIFKDLLKELKEFEVEEELENEEIDDEDIEYLEYD